MLILFIIGIWINNKLKHILLKSLLQAHHWWIFNLPVGDSTFRSNAGKSLSLNKESGFILPVIIKLYGILILIVGFLMKYRRKYRVVKKNVFYIEIIENSYWWTSNRPHLRVLQKWSFYELWGKEFSFLRYFFLIVWN